MESIIVKNISKFFANVKALQSVSFDVRNSEIFGIIGPDGAGKTTLIRVLTTLICPDAGQAIVEGYDVVSNYKEIRKIAGYMPQRFSLYTDLTVEENLRFYAEIFGASIEQNYSLIEPIYKHIEPFKKRKAKELSGGMKQKLALSCALIHKPKVLFLDEPTTGVDAISRVEFWELLKKYKEMGITILASTPYMDEAMQCDRLAFINKGKIFKVSTPEEILASYPYKIYGIKSEKLNLIFHTVKENYPDIIITRFGSALHCSLTKDENEIEHIFSNFGKVQINEIKPTIEDCFLFLAQANEQQ